MRTLIISSITCLLIASCNNDGVKNGWTEANLKGKVKSFKWTSYYAKERFGEIVKRDRQKIYCCLGRPDNIQEPVFMAVYEYDEQGNKIVLSGYDSDGDLDFRDVNKYDEQGNEIEVSRYDSDGDLDIRDAYQYDFDRLGNWIKRVRFENEIPRTIDEREYEYYD
jgi:hypothetical protein